MVANLTEITNDELQRRNLCQARVMHDLYTKAVEQFPGLASPVGRKEFMSAHYFALWSHQFEQYWDGERHKPHYDAREHLKFMQELYTPEKLMALEAQK